MEFLEEIGESGWEGLVVVSSDQRINIDGTTARPVTGARV